MSLPSFGLGDFTPGLSLIPSDLNVSNQAGVSVPANSAVNLGTFNMASPAYAIAIDSLCPAGATQGLLKVTFGWNDPVTGLTVDEQVWYIAGTKTSPASTAGLTVGRGPTSAATVNVTVHNYDGANAVTIDFALWQSSRLVTRHDWRGLAQAGNYPTYTTPNSEAASSVLGWENTLSMAGGASTSWQCALYAGQAMFQVEMDAAANFSFDIFAPLADRSGTNWPTMFEGTFATAAATLYLSLPRCPVVVNIQNVTGVAHTIIWSLLVQEFAS